MLAGNLADYLEINQDWKKKTLTELTIQKNGEALIASDEIHMYDFDEITTGIFPNRDKPTSVDALGVNGKKICFVEFKTGFKDKIGRQNFDENNMTCPYDKNKVCKPYSKLFLKGRVLEKNELIDNIRLKAIESYITLEKMILPECEYKENPLQIVLFVIIDADAIDEEEEILSGLASITPQDNAITSVKSALSRLKRTGSHSGQFYYYDDVRVITFQEARIKLENRNIL